jgi:predicted phosphodiesterase
MRIALLSDIHGNLAALEAVVADFGRRGVDVVANLGDSLSGPLLPGETARYLMARDWVQLRGNHERQVLDYRPGSGDPADGFARSRLGADELAWIAGLPPALALDDEVFLCHGTPTLDAAYFLETAAPGQPRLATAAEIAGRLGGVASALVACGHTHVTRIVRNAAGQLLVNPGSVGQPAYDDDQPVAHKVENGSPDARYAIAERLDGRWSACLIAVPYDHDAMAALALSHGRPDWAHLLRTGYLP